LDTQLKYRLSKSNPQQYNYPNWHKTDHAAQTMQRKSCQLGTRDTPGSFLHWRGALYTYNDTGFNTMSYLSKSSYDNILSGFGAYARTIGRLPEIEPKIIKLIKAIDYDARRLEEGVFGRCRVAGGWRR